MKKYFKKPFILLSLIIAITITIVGCQAISNIDINQVLTKNLNEKSFETNNLIRFNVDFTPTANTDEQTLSILNLINEMNIHIHSIKENGNNTSFDGTINIQKGNIPFKISVNDNEIVILLDNANKPIVIKNTNNITQYNIIKALGNSNFSDIKDKVSTFIFKNLPNPNVISITDDSQIINGENLNLKKLHAEINGNELYDIVQKFIDNLINDKEGLKDFITTISKFEQNLNSQKNSIVFRCFGTDIYGKIYDHAGICQSKDGVTYQAKDIPITDSSGVNTDINIDNVIDLLKNAKDNITELRKSTPLDENTYLKTDLYFDKDLYIRKSVTDIKLKSPKNDNGINSISLHLESSIFNINQDLKAQPILHNDKVINADSTLRQFTNSLDQNNSILYDVIKNNLKLTYNKLSISTATIADDHRYTYYKLINKSGISFVSLRYISDYLDSKTTWNDETKEITVDDGKNNILLTINSDKAYVNGKLVILDSPVYIDNQGSAMVSLRFICEALGANVTWDSKNKKALIEIN